METDGWGEIDILNDGRTLRSVFEGNQGRFWIYAKIPADLDILLCYSRCPFDAPTDILQLASELISHINFGLRVGNFEINMNSGEIRFKSSLDFRRVNLSDSLILNVLLPCAYAMDQFLPAFNSLILDRKSLSLSLAKIAD